MRESRTFIQIIAFAFINACIDDSSSNCYIPLESPTGSYEVKDAGSNQYNGKYTSDYETKVNDKVVYVHEDNSLYTIEYDSSNVWCIKDTGILEYCMYPFANDNFPGRSSILFFLDVRNGASPGPSFDVLKQTLFIKCEDM